MKIEVFKHATIRLISEKVIYFDPYQVENDLNYASYIFITHEHYDHFDKESINKLLSNQTILIVPTCLKEKAYSLTKNVLIVEPNKTYRLADLTFDTIPAYNINSTFHCKDKNYVGYNVLIDNKWYYIMGDTDATVESTKVKTDICFVPIGGTYTMDAIEAAHYINSLKPKIAIPIHYGSIVGDKSLAEDFKKLINEEIKVEILI